MPGITFYPEEEEMRKERSIVWTVTSLLMVATMLLASCGGGQTQAPAATEVPATQDATEATGEVAVGQGDLVGGIDLPGLMHGGGAAVGGVVKIR